MSDWRVSRERRDREVLFGRFDKACEREEASRRRDDREVLFDELDELGDVNKVCERSNTSSTAVSSSGRFFREHKKMSGLGYFVPRSMGPMLLSSDDRGFPWAVEEREQHLDDLRGQHCGVELDGISA